MDVVENCQLEWDHDRGVLYVHNKATGCTVLRICGLPKTVLKDSGLEIGQIDITLSPNQHIVSLPFVFKH